MCTRHTSTTVDGGALAAPERSQDTNGRRKVVHGDGEFERGRVGTHFIESHADATDPEDHLHEAVARVVEAMRHPIHHVRADLQRRQYQQRVEKAISLLVAALPEKSNSPFARTT